VSAIGRNEKHGYGVGRDCGGEELLVFSTTIANLEWRRRTVLAARERKIEGEAVRQEL